MGGQVPQPRQLLLSLLRKVIVRRGGIADTTVAGTFAVFKSRPKRRFAAAVPQRVLAQPLLKGCQLVLKLFEFF